MTADKLRADLVRITKKLDVLGLSHGTSGNLSVRYGEGFLITPSGFGDAFRKTVEVENLSELYLRALQVGEPVLLSADEFQDAQKRFTTYGKPVS
ncbi:MAG: class II aldolase/adducin family protein [Gallionella sp.]|nr:class II aldolase/adducin family protein [Gallionella sp.]